VSQCSGQRQVPAERGILQIGHQPTGSDRLGLIERIPQAFRGNGIHGLRRYSYSCFRHATIVHGAGERNLNKTPD
jgi:hypothetical protein